MTYPQRLLHTLLPSCLLVACGDASPPNTEEAGDRAQRASMDSSDRSSPEQELDEDIDQHRTKIGEALRRMAAAQSNWFRLDVDANGEEDYLAGRDAHLSRLYYERLDGEQVAFTWEDLAKADALDHAEPYLGYLFRSMSMNQEGTPYSERKSSQFGIVAYPATYGQSGRITYLINEAGRVISRDVGDHVVMQWPSGEYFKNGWLLEINFQLPPLKTIPQHEIDQAVERERLRDLDDD